MSNEGVVCHIDFFLVYTSGGLDKVGARRRGEMGGKKLLNIDVLNRWGRVNTIRWRMLRNFDEKLPTEAGLLCVIKWRLCGFGRNLSAMCRKLLMGDYFSEVYSSDNEIARFKFIHCGIIDK